MTTASLDIIAREAAKQARALRTAHHALRTAHQLLAGVKHSCNTLHEDNEALMVAIRKLSRENARLFRIANLGLKARDYWVDRLGLPEGSIAELRADVGIASTFGEMSALEREHNKRSN